jgi:hypothetical protein
MQHSQFKIQNGRPVVAARLTIFAFCILQLAFSWACAKAKAADLVPDGPPLAMSAPPPRVITPAEGVAVAPPSPPNPETPAPAATGATSTRQPTGKPAPQRPTTGATDTPAAAAAQPEPPPPAAPPPLEVRAVSSAAAAAEEKKVRDVMGRTTAILNKVNYQRLNAEGKKQYDQSKRFNEQADEAVKEKNFVYAMQLAENAATFAAQLAGR